VSFLAVLSLLGDMRNLTSSASLKQHAERSTAALRATESRFDPISGRWTIFAPDRDRRPDDFDTHAATETRRDCPFCCGNELASPPAVWIGILDDDKRRIYAGGGERKDWTVRVVPNLYPAVSSESQAGSFAEESPLLQRRAARGAHEVFIESRQHIASLSSLDLAEVQLTFLAFRDRLIHWRDAGDIGYVSIFKNVGHRAGASLVHSHSQLLATDRVPRSIESGLGRMQRHRSETGCCLQCDLIRAEQKSGQRIVWQDPELIAWCPFASRMPMLLRITTRSHQACFEDLSESTIDSIAQLVYRAVGWLEQLRGGTAYNLCLYTRPPAASDPADSFHWSLELFPRMTELAGFELSSGCMISPVLPEQAAAGYRRAASAEDPR